MNNEVVEAPGASDLIDRVRHAWAEVLDKEDASAVPLDANFLEVGGTSLLLIMLWEELAELTSQDLRVSQLFRHTTVRSQAALLAGKATDETVAPTVDRGRLLGVRGDRR